MTSRTGSSDTNGFVNALPMLHHRQMPSIAGGALSLDQVVTMGGKDADLGQPWKVMRPSS